MNSIPLLYSFRRCPFAIRARMALVKSGIQVAIREVKLSNMPAEMLMVSPKATVPVMVLPGGEVIDESIDIMRWSLARSDPESWLPEDNDSKELIFRNDGEFKPLLDRYKYADRLPELDVGGHRLLAVEFLQELEQRLQANRFLVADRIKLADIAIMPFVRQFAGVEPGWFAECQFALLRNWLDQMHQGELFNSVMKKYRFWQPGDNEVIFGQAC